MDSSGVLNAAFYQQALGMKTRSFSSGHKWKISAGKVSIRKTAGKFSPKEQLSPKVTFLINIEDNIIANFNYIL